MPAYISHAIMGEQLYNESIKENLFSKIYICKDEMKGYSLGPDLAYLSPILKNDPQNYHTREFFKNTIKYIKSKYGFTPQIGTAKCTFDNSDNFSSSCNEKIIVNAKYNNKWL